MRPRRAFRETQQAIGIRRRVRTALDDPIVARKFALQIELPADPYEAGAEEEQRAADALHGIDESVTTAQVRDFVQDDAVQVVRLEFVDQMPRYQNHRVEAADRDGKV